MEKHLCNGSHENSMDLKKMEKMNEQKHDPIERIETNWSRRSFLAESYGAFRFLIDKASYCSAEPHAL